MYFAANKVNMTLKLHRSSKKFKIHINSKIIPLNRKLA